MPKKDITMLPRSTPEMQGIKSSGILQFIERGERTIDDLHSVMLLRHGRGLRLVGALRRANPARTLFAQQELYLYCRWYSHCRRPPWPRRYGYVFL